MLDSNHNRPVYNKRNRKGLEKGRENTKQERGLVHQRYSLRLTNSASLRVQSGCPWRPHGPNVVDVRVISATPVSVKASAGRGGSDYGDNGTDFGVTMALYPWSELPSKATLNHLYGNAGTGKFKLY